MLILISGVSGVGKNTVIKELLAMRKNLFYVYSGTTREKRKSEIEKNYIHMTKAEFCEREKNGEFFETQEVHGFMYGVLKSSLDEAQEKPFNDYIKDIDVFGNKKIRSFMKDKAKVVSIFLDAPDDVLKERLKNRGETEERIKVRLSRADIERAHKKEYDFVIENLNLENTIKSITKIIEKIKNDNN